MPADELRPNASGGWVIRQRSSYEVNAGGYGNGGWTYELIELATGRVVETWSGDAHQSPWDSGSGGVTNVRWDGDTLVITHAPAEGLLSEAKEERVALADLLARG